MAEVEVRLTIRPDETIRLHEADVPQLAHQGLVIGEPTPVAETAARAAARNPDAKPRTPKAAPAVAANEGDQP